MKKLFKDHQTAVTFGSVIAVLNVLMAITCYYMQYDSGAISWASLLGAFFTLILSVVVIMYNKGTNTDKMLVGVGFTAWSALMLVSGILKVISSITSVAQPEFYFSLAALPVASLFILAYADTIVFGKRIVNRLYYIIPVAVLAIVPTVLMFIFYNVQAMFYVYFAALAIIFIAGIVFAVMAIIKKKAAFFSWSYLFYTLGAAASVVLRLINYFATVKTFPILTSVVILLSVTFMLLGCIIREEN